MPPSLGRLARTWASRVDDDAPWGARFVLVTGVLAGAVSLVFLLGTRPAMLGVNAHVYYLVGDVAVAGGDLYGVAPPGFAHLPYVYPPLVTLAFVPYALLGSWQLAFAVHTALTLAGSLVLARLLVSLAEAGGTRLARLDRLLVGAYVVGSVHVVASLYYGNVNPLLVLALAAGVVLVDRAPARAGALFALPAVVKVFPAAFGVWLLRRRDWRAVGGAVATGLLAVATSLVVFGVGPHRAYLEEALLPRRRTELFVGGLPPEAQYLTVRRPLSVLLPGADPVVLALLAGLVLAPVAVYLLLADVESGVGALVALHGTVACTVLFFTSYQTYYVFLLVTVVPLLYRLREGPPRTLFLAGAAVANVAVTMPAVRAVLDPPVEGPVLALVEPVLTLGSPRLYGVALTLLACGWYRRRGG